MRRLSGWQRIGIVVTVAWIVGAFGYAFWHHYDTVWTYPRTVLSVCLSSSTSDEADERCHQRYEEARNIWEKIPFNWEASMITGLGPVPVFWLTGWFLLSIARWVWRGFSPDSD